MNKVLRGKVWRYEGIMDVDGDIIGRGGNRMPPGTSAEERLKRYAERCLTSVDPDFPKKVHKGDFVVGGPGFGYGHDHEQACLALIGCGVGAVLTEAANANFKRNSIAFGLPVAGVKGIMSATKTGDELEVDLVKGTVKNITKGKTLSFTPFPKYILEILEAGGVNPLVEKRVKAGLYGAKKIPVGAKRK